MHLLSRSSKVIFRRRSEINRMYTRHHQTLIPMPDTFTPHIEEKMLTITVSAREAHLIYVLRKYRFGKIVVHKADGVLIRLEPNESQLLSEEEGIKVVSLGM